MALFGGQRSRHSERHRYESQAVAEPTAGQSAQPDVATSMPAAAPRRDASPSLPAARPRRLELPTAGPARLVIPGVTVRRIEQTCQVSITIASETIGFTVDSAEIGVDGRAVLQLLAAELTGSGVVRIFGHSSSEGSRSHNVALSFARASALREVLDRLLPGRSFDVEGRGPDEPIADNGTEEGRRRNRRVEITSEIAGCRPGPGG